MSLRRFRLTPIVLALGAFGFLFSTAAAQIERGGPTRPTPTPAPTVPGAVPTMDRLAAPPTVAAPNQADEGEQLFWLHCQPCHGDRGQGLTDEWRAQYPPEDQYCWNSGCHGPQPYDQDFLLPTVVPAVIGDGTLQKFTTLDSVYRYVSVSMPYFFPGDLTTEEYLAITAHMARANGLWDGRTLTLDNLGEYAVPGAIVAAALATPPATATAPAVAQSQPPPGTATGQPAHSSGPGPLTWIAVPAGAITLALMGGFVLWLRRGRSN